MDTHEELHSDLSYVRRAIERSGTTRSSRAIYLLWAAAIVVGFPLTDFAPQWVGWYWVVVGPLGLVASLWLGWRAGVRQGQRDRARGYRHALHWTGMMVCIFLTVPLALAGVLPWEALSKIILLILALGYFLAGVHLERPLLWVGLLMLVGYGLLFVLDTYAWTILGAILGGAMILTAFLVGRNDGGR